MKDVFGPGRITFCLLCAFASNAVMGLDSKRKSWLGSLRPNFTVSVDPPSRSLRVSVTTDFDARVRLCYRRREEICAELTPKVLEIVTAESPNVTLSFPFLLPCLCVQVYYSVSDAVRTTVCPFQTLPLDGMEVWHTSKRTLYNRHLEWESLCPMKPSAALCWRTLKVSPDCLAVANSTLLANSTTNNPLLTNYDISRVDKHPNMCVKFSLNGTSQEYCEFKEGLTEWEPEVFLSSLYAKVYITASFPASYSARLCLMQGQECISQGDVRSVSKEDGANDKELLLPLTSIQTGLCVQVWRTDPLLNGWRLFCPDSSHRRWGLVVVAVTIFAASGFMLAYVGYYAAQRELSAWQLSRRPVLLVCSSEQTEQLSATCALASILQGELCTSVHMAHLASGGVADLGPLPWLYGQCETVRAAGGRVLVVWSPEGSLTYRSWWGPMIVERVGREAENDTQRRGMAKSAGGDSAHGDGCHMERVVISMESSGVTTSVFGAALAYLQGVLRWQDYGQTHGFALVCFEGLCCSQDIPPELKGLPIYQLPHDFRTLVQELYVCPLDCRWRCWHRLFSTVQSYRVAGRLAHKLRVWMPARQDNDQKKKSLCPGSHFSPDSQVDGSLP